MPDLQFKIENVEAVPFAAAPQLLFRVRITNTAADEEIHSVVLRCQVRIEPVQRSYKAADHEHLRDLFGEPERWSQTLRSMLWAHCTVVAPAFTGNVAVELPVPCTFDFTVASAKYFYALDDGDVPLLFLFSGTVFYANAEGAWQVAPISWNCEASYRLPVRVWRDMMDHYYPNSAWLCLRRDVFDRLYRFKINRGLPTWEQTLEALLLGDAQDKP